MLILLPPSETKRTRPRGRSADPARLSFPQLTATRSRVAAALVEVSGTEDACARLGVSPRLADEVERNLHLDTAPALPAEQLYTGVLYDALDVDSLDDPARRRLRREVVIISALYGALRLTDRVAPYRLSMGASLPDVGRLAAAWRGPLGEVLPATAGRDVVVDCRSSTYVAAWAPQGEAARRWVQIRVPGATHMAKHTRGLVARELAGVTGRVRTPQALADVLATRFHVRLHSPARATAPWVLDTTAR